MNTLTNTAQSVSLAEAAAGSGEDRGRNVSICLHTHHSDHRPTPAGSQQLAKIN